MRAHTRSSVHCYALCLSCTHQPPVCLSLRHTCSCRPQPPLSPHASSDQACTLAGEQGSDEDDEDFEPEELSPEDLAALRQQYGDALSNGGGGEEADYDFGEYGMDGLGSGSEDSEASDSEDELGMSADDPRSSVSIEDVTEVRPALM